MVIELDKMHIALVHYEFIGVDPLNSIIHR